MKRQVPAQSFTVQYDRRVRQLFLDVGLSEAFDPQSGLQQPQITKFLAIWDTGASASAISSNVVAALNLKPVGMTQMHTAGGVGQANTHLVNVYLPNSVAFSGLRVAEAQLLGGGDVLIGMDIIGLGDFSITHSDGKTCMSFRLPSLERIDYVQETSKARAALSAAAAGQNAREARRKFLAQKLQKKRR